MFNFITNNIGTIIVGGLVLLAVFFVLRKMIKDKKAGKSSCGCNCANCPNSNNCH